MFRKDLSIENIAKENDCEKYEYQRTAIDEIDEWIRAADGEVKEHFLCIRDVLLFKDVNIDKYMAAENFFKTCKHNELIEKALLYAVNRPNF